MRVCMLTTSFPRSQNDYAGIFIFRLCRALASAGLSVDVISPAESGVPSQEKMEGCSIHRFSYFFPSSWQQFAYGRGGIPENIRRKPWLFFQAPFFLLGFLLKCFKIGRKADLIHVHWIYSGLIALLVKATCGIPFVLTLRGSDVRHAGQGGVRGILSQCILKRAACITTVSQALREWVLSQGIREERVFFIRNGVDLAVEKIKMNRAAGCRFIFVGNLIPGKGLSDLIEALSIVTRSEKEIHLRIVGDGPERKNLQNLVEDRGMDRSIQFMGVQAPSRIPALMAESDCLVLPSLSEGTPNVVLEAMSSGLPVVGSNIPGIREIVQDGITGLLTKTGDSDDLAKKLLIIVLEKARRQKMGKKGREAIKEMGLGWDRVASQYHEVYQKVCAESQGSST